MPTVRELTGLYEGVMLAPARGAGICETCLTFTEGFSRCYVCERCPAWLDAVAPISYSIAHEQLHHALASYKRLRGMVAERLQLQLTAILWRYLELHETCLARAADLRPARPSHHITTPSGQSSARIDPGPVSRFDLVTTVPSGHLGSDAAHPLEHMVGSICAPTRDRYRPLLTRSDLQPGDHDFDARKFEAVTALNRETVLLIDDTWTTGASAQSAAAALKRAGATTVAVVVIGRHLKRDWRANDRRLRALPRCFDWETCVHCRPAASLASAPQCRQ